MSSDRLGAVMQCIRVPGHGSRKVRQTAALEQSRPLLAAAAEVLLEEATDDEREVILAGSDPPEIKIAKIVCTTAKVKHILQKLKDGELPVQGAGIAADGRWDGIPWRCRLSGYRPCCSPSWSASPSWAISRCGSIRITHRCRGASRTKRAGC